MNVEHQAANYADGIRPPETSLPTRIPGFDNRARSSNRSMLLRMLGSSSTTATVRGWAFQIPLLNELMTTPISQLRDCEPSVNDGGYWPLGKKQAGVDQKPRASVRGVPNLSATDTISASDVTFSFSMMLRRCALIVRSDVFRSMGNLLVPLAADD